MRQHSLATSAEFEQASPAPPPPFTPGKTAAAQPPPRPPSCARSRQVDCKAIPAVCGSLLVALDQHAADERVQLEALQGRLEAQLAHSSGGGGGSGGGSCRDGAGGYGCGGGAVAGAMAGGHDTRAAPLLQFTPLLPPQVGQRCWAPSSGAPRCPGTPPAAPFAVARPTVSAPSREEDPHSIPHPNL